MEEAVDKEVPPQAASLKEVWENCQGWCVRVLKRLGEEGVVSEEMVERVRGMVDPV